jgi:DNA-binding IscR family transcriptional regulator
MNSYVKRDSRLSSMLHVLLHMAQHPGPRTSEDLARMLATNPVVVRRTLAGLREHGLVAAEKGHGGGWALARAPAAISLLDVHAALGEPSLFALGHRNDQPGCQVERAVNAALDGTLAEAEALIRARLGAVTLATLLAQFPEDSPHA